MPAFTTGDARFTAGMWMVYDAGRMSIVEPTEFLTGADYCRRLALPDTSPKCANRFVPVASGMRVSVPIAADPQYLDYRKNPKTCQDPRTRAGTCRVTFREFSTVSEESSPWPALVTIRRGQVTAVARLNLR